MAPLGVKPGAAGWKVQTNPLSYGGTPEKSSCLCVKKNRRKKTFEKVSGAQKTKNAKALMIRWNGHLVKTDLHAIWLG